MCLAREPDVLGIALDGVDPGLRRAVGERQRGVAERAAELEDALGAGRRRDRAEQRAVAVGIRAAAVLGAMLERRLADLGERVGRGPRHQRAPRARHAPASCRNSRRASSPISARGAFSMPSTTSSRYLMRPSRSQADTSRRKSPWRAAKSETMKPRKRQPLGQDRPRQRGGSQLARRHLGGVVGRDLAADRHAGEIVEQRKHRLEHRAADILEIDVDALRARRLEPRRQIAAAMVDAGVEAELLDHVAALLRPARDADGTRALDPGDLADQRADGAGRRRHHHGLARLRLADLERPV